MRYIMILSLCLVGFDGYAASAATDSNLPAPINVKGPDFHKILQEGYFVHSGKTWKVDKIYPYESEIFLNLPIGRPIDSTKATDRTAMLELMDSEGWATLMNYRKIDDSSPYLSHDNQHIFYYAGRDNSEFTFLVVFNLTKPESTH